MYNAFKSTIKHILLMLAYRQLHPSSYNVNTAVHLQPSSGNKMVLHLILR